MTRKGDLIDLDMESGLFGTLHLDNGAVPAEERPGTAKKLLAASALYCYCAALDKALESRRRQIPQHRRARHGGNRNRRQGTRPCGRHDS